MGIRVSITALVLLLSWPASAIIVRHDRADSRYVVDMHDYPQVFYLHERFGNKLCIATLIAPRWAITAGHCTEQTPLAESMERGESYAVQVAGRDNAVVRMVLHPAFRQPGEDYPRGVDLALLELAEETAVAPVRLYTGHEEQDSIVELLGWGFTGIGTVRRRSNDGKLRRAYNRVSMAGDWLEVVFDDPRQAGTGAVAQALEGIPALGDSGGPLLMKAGMETGMDANSLQILGVARGEVLAAGNEEWQGAPGLYGAVSMYERLSLHQAWIRDTISGPAVSAVDSF